MRVADFARRLGISGNRFRRLVDRLMEQTGYRRKTCRRMVLYRYAEAVTLCRFQGAEPTYARLASEIAVLEGAPTVVEATATSKSPSA